MQEKKPKCCESQTYLYPSKEPSSNVFSSRRCLIIILFLNFVTISIITGYVLYNERLLESTIDKPFVDWQRDDSTHYIATYYASSLNSNGVFKAPPPSKTDSTSKQCTLADENKFDCNPDEPVSQQVCESRGCCWVPVTIKKRNVQSLNVPQCFYPSDYKGYEIADVQQEKNSALIKLVRKVASGFPQDISNVSVEITGLDDERLRIRFVDAEKDRFEVPMPFFNVSEAEQFNSTLYKITINQDGKLLVSRTSTGTVIFNADLSTLIYSDKFIQLSVRVPSQYLYGLGEHKASFKKDLTGWNRYTMFARDIGPTEGVNLYGSYPFYIMPEDDDSMNAHGVFLLNSNAMDVITQSTPAITYLTIGGILDFFLFLGPTASQVARQNINLIGRPVLQPYWSFGFHLCRYGYDSLNKTRETLERNLAVGIPIEAQWNDIDYMDRFNDFTYDKVNYAGLGDFVKELHSKNMHYVIILDPGVSAAEPAGTYPPYDDGVKADIFVKNSTDQIFVGKVWNLVSTVYPDFTNPATTDYWKNQLVNLRKEIDFDGIWIDMNEPSNFYNGQIDGCPNDPYEKPPYVPGGTDLKTKTLCMNAKQYAGIHYNVHSLYGLYENVVTYNAALDIFKARPFILSRSTYPSQGHYASHWSGDIESSWDHMKYSISNMLEFNVYGIPMIGSDICGFAGNTEVELCMRWSSLGAFYPFSRNHNDKNKLEQDPAILGETVVAAAKYALEARYKMLPYLYTLFAKANMNGDTVVRSLFFEFPLDKNTYSIETAFLWGSSLYIIPVLEPQKTQVDAYFPNELWYNFEDKKLAFNSTGESKTIQIDNDKIGLFMRGGSIVPVYQSSANTTTELRKQKYYLNGYLDKSGHAVGEIYHDDGKSIDSIESGIYIHADCKANKDHLVCNYLNMATFDDFNIGGVTISGLSEKPKRINLNGKSLSTDSFTHDDSILTIELPEDFNSSQSFSIDFSY
ncbi:lysosomal alpha-glucosidase [Tetranychus urticae]|uniref:P-type domain-containing protein n=1 Tax=Tetranychus urticae TaxID=32264 RepID=T1K729_TETUR|nr:lysosomal alpha-glucosidase [Tetranychus urticae]